MPQVTTFDVEDHEFIFLGGFVRTHTIKAGEDTVLDEDDKFIIVYTLASQIITIYKHNLLQHSVTSRTVTKTDESAVQKIVREMKERENKLNQVTGPTLVHSKDS